MSERKKWTIVLAAIIGAGLLSRLNHTGLILIDKYLGDALYAAMMYALLKVVAPRRPAALPAMAIMIAIETFQLTGIPARLVENGNAIARLLGTTFSFADIAAYAAGITTMWLIDKQSR